jgi:hypothetical protein
MIEQEIKPIGLIYKKPFKSELELNLYNLFCSHPELSEKYEIVDMTQMTGQEKKQLIDKIHLELGLKKWRV